MKSKHSVFLLAYSETSQGAPDPSRFRTKARLGKGKSKSWILRSQKAWQGRKSADKSSFETRFGTFSCGDTRFQREGGKLGRSCEKSKLKKGSFLIPPWAPPSLERPGENEHIKVDHGRRKEG